MSDLTALIILTLGIINIFTSGLEVYFMNVYFKGALILFPSSIYKVSKINWFGCWFIYIVMSILSPVLFIMKLFIMIMIILCDFVNWLFTVGRKDDE